MWRIQSIEIISSSLLQSIEIVRSYVHQRYADMHDQALHKAPYQRVRQATKVIWENLRVMTELNW
jgi:hypothetical protein